MTIWTRSFLTLLASLALVATIGCQGKQASEQAEDTASPGQQHVLGGPADDHDPIGSHTLPYAEHRSSPPPTTLAKTREGGPPLGQYIDCNPAQGFSIELMYYKQGTNVITCDAASVAEHPTCIPTCPPTARCYEVKGQSSATSHISKKGHEHSRDTMTVNAYVVIDNPPQYASKTP